MNHNFAKKLELRVCETKVDAQKINSSKLDTFDKVITFFSIEDKKRSSYFFEEKFLLADISIYIALNMPFLILSNIKTDFVDCHIYWRLYTIAKVLLIIRQVKLVGKKEFAIATRNLKNEVFEVHIPSISLNLEVHPS